MKLTVTGSKELTAAIRAAAVDIETEVGKAVMATAFELRANVKKKLRAPGKGTIYYRIFDPETGYTTIYAGDSEGYVTSFKGKTALKETHRASADGDAPASDTGRLANSIYFDKNGRLSASVGSVLAYARHLEYGTISMAARPYFRPAIEEIQPKLVARLEDAIKGVFK